MEVHENRLKRLRMRSWRRGTKEMDLILGPFADDRLADLNPEMLDQFEDLLGENDHDLYRWVSGQEDFPTHFSDILQAVKSRLTTV